MSARRRLDQEIVRRKLAPSREAAQRLIADGVVLVGGAIADKPARQVLPGDDVKLTAPAPPFVSRAGVKLAGALDQFAIDPGGMVCLDAGSSTGGFTDCLLQRSAQTVYAVDVGTNQLHEKIRRHPRVRVYEQTDIRRVAPEDLDQSVDLVVADLSFISLQLVMAALVGLSRPGTEMLLLVKPQFEAGRQEASKGRGVITDPAIWNRVIHEVEAAAAASGAAMLDLMTSPITGSSGNVEFVGRFTVGVATLPAHLVLTKAKAAISDALFQHGNTDADQTSESP